MVTAGVYMVARSHVIFDHAPNALSVVAIVGTLTALFAATIGIAQTDIKKVLAYSTVSQLGYMCMACGVAAYSAGIFHLMTHAFFKGLLFLAAGSVIHAVGGEQDMRKMGGLRQYIPWTFLTMTVATFAIAGFWPFAGFFSKDEILWQAYSSSHGSWVFWLIGVITAFITSFYMFRLWFMTFFGDYRGAATSDHGHNDSHAHGAHEHGTPHESPTVMLVPLAILAMLSLVGGWVNIGGRFEHFLAPVFQTSGLAETATETAEVGNHGTEYLLMAISLGAAALGLYFAYLLYFKNRDLPQKIADALGGFYEAVVHKYYVDEIYATLFVKPLVDGSTRILWHGVDQGVIDAAVNDTAQGARHASDAARHMQSGNLRSYAGWVAAGGAVVIAYMIWMGVR
jgi:NADH-quinone oxidoreductase subunit L